MSGGSHKPVPTSQDKPGWPGAAGLTEQVGQPVATTSPGTADATAEGPTECSFTVRQVGVVGVSAQMGEDPNAVVADGYFQATGSSGLSGVRLGSYIGTPRAAPMTDGIVDQLTDTAGDLSTRRRTKVGNSEKTYALTYVVGGLRGQESGLKESRAMVTPVVERNGPDDSGALGKLGEEVHPLQVGGDTRIGGETQHTLAGHDRSGLGEC